MGGNRSKGLENAAATFCFGGLKVAVLGGWVDDWAGKVEGPEFLACLR